MATRFTLAINVVDAARAELRVFSITADFRAVMPAAYAFGMFTCGYPDSDTHTVGELNRFTICFMQRGQTRFRGYQYKA